MPEIKDGQYNINLKWFEFLSETDDDIPVPYDIWINFEKVTYVKYTPATTPTEMVIGFVASTETLRFENQAQAEDAYAKMRYFLNVINVPKLPSQGS